MNRLSLGFLLLLFAPLACSLVEPTPPPIEVLPAATGIPPVAGTYRISGVGLDRRGYEGTLTISREGAVYHLTWQVGTTTYIGVGILQSDILSVGWDADGNCGVVSYHVLPDGTLEGLWSVCSQNRVGTERAIRQ